MAISESCWGFANWVQATLDSMGWAPLRFVISATKRERLRLVLAIVLIVTMLAIFTQSAGGGADFACRTTLGSPPDCTAGYTAPGP
jgi:hypothetical protein